MFNDSSLEDLIISLVSLFSEVFSRGALNLLSVQSFH